VCRTGVQTKSWTFLSWTVHLAAPLESGADNTKRWLVEQKI